MSDIKQLAEKLVNDIIETHTGGSLATDLSLVGFHQVEDGFEAQAVSGDASLTVVAKASDGDDDADDARSDLSVRIDLPDDRSVEVVSHGDFTALQARNLLSACRANASAVHSLSDVTQALSAVGSSLDGSIAEVDSADALISFARGLKPVERTVEFGS